MQSVYLYHAGVTARDKSAEQRWKGEYGVQYWQQSRRVHFWGLTRQSSSSGWSRLSPYPIPGGAADAPGVPNWPTCRQRAPGRGGAARSRALRMWEYLTRSGSRCGGPGQPVIARLVNLPQSRSLIRVGTRLSWAVPLRAMETLAALGLACNIMQAISFSLEAATICKSILRTGSQDPALDQAADGFTKVIADLERSLRSAGTLLSENDRELVNLTSQILVTAAGLKDASAVISANSAAGKYAAAIKGTARAMSSKRRVEKLEKVMAAQQKSLESRVLLRIW